MIAVVLILAAAAALGAGIAMDNQALVYAALGMSMAAAGLVLATRLVPQWRLVGAATDRAADEPAEAAEPAEPELIGADAILAPGHGVAGADLDGAAVVFIAGRTTFHSPECPLFAGKARSSALRAELVAGGMTPCKRCLPV